MADQTIPTDRDLTQPLDVPAELARPLEERIADSQADKASRLAEMRAARADR